MNKIECSLLQRQFFSRLAANSTNIPNNDIDSCVTLLLFYRVNSITIPLTTSLFALIGCIMPAIDDLMGRANDPRYNRHCAFHTRYQSRAIDDISSDNHAAADQLMSTGF